jgi:hypothetical protein
MEPATLGRYRRVALGPTRPPGRREPTPEQFAVLNELAAATVGGQFVMSADLELYLATQPAEPPGERLAYSVAALNGAMARKWTARRSSTAAARAARG